MCKKKVTMIHKNKNKAQNNYEMLVQSTHESAKNDVKAEQTRQIKHLSAMNPDKVQKLKHINMNFIFQQ